MARTKRSESGARAGALLAAIALSACADHVAGGGEVRIGTITSLTGDLGEYGGGWRDAVKLAVQEVNAAGGLLGGRRVELLVENDETTPAGAGRAASRLVAEKVVGVIGAPGSDQTLEAIKVTGAARIPQLSGTSTSSLINTVDADGLDSHPYFFRTVPADDLQGFVLGSLVAGAYDGEGLATDCPRIAVVNIDNGYGRPFGDAIAERCTELGGTVVHRLAHQGDRPNYDGAVAEMVAAAPDCIAMVAYAEGARIVNAWYTLGGSPAVRWFGTEGIKNAEIMRDMAGHAEGFLGTAPASNPNRTELRAFRDAYQASFGQAPVVFADAIYDATALLLLAIEQAGSTDGDAIARALFVVARDDEGDRPLGPNELLTAIETIHAGPGVNFEGAVGSLELLDNGDVVGDYEVWRFTGGGFETVRSIRADDILREMEGRGGG